MSIEEIGRLMEPEINELLNEIRVAVRLSQQEDIGEGSSSLKEGQALKEEVWKMPP
jgi:hypothetical protein